MFFAAIELKAGEDVKDGVKAFLYATSDNGVQFSKLKVYGILTIGSRRFVRFASDCGVYSQPVIQRVTVEGRGLVVPSKSGIYQVILANGRVGKIGAAQMQAVEQLGYGQMWRGPKDDLWEGQF